jgi:YVTN family beta-propeller protein
VESIREIPGHNIRGLALSADGGHVLVAHQTLSRLARTEQSDIHWGLLSASSVLRLALEAVLDPDADILQGSRSLRLGDVGRGAGDPAGLVALGERRLLVAASGTGEVLQVSGEETRRVQVGARPTALLASADASAVYVANTFSDSVSVIDPDRLEVVREIRLGPRPELSPAARGERLFYDARLSHGGWFSCHSCHTDGHTSGRLADTLGDGSYGDPKRILPLGGVAETGPWAWNGQVTRLEDQIEKSVRTTMHGPPLTDAQTADLTAYLQKLSPAPAVADSGRNADLVRRGRALFDELRCATCHVPPTWTSPQVFDVGMTDEAGRQRFNPPSLRGVGQRSRFFHDGRSPTLEDVFSTHQPGLGRAMSEQERRALSEFLRTL